MGKKRKRKWDNQFLFLIINNLHRVLVEKKSMNQQNTFVIMLIYLCSLLIGDVSFYRYRIVFNMCY